MKRVYGDKKASVHWSAARNKERFSSPRINRVSTGCQPVVLFSSIGLHRISLVRASGETFRRRVFDALGGTRDACLLGELFCRRPVLPDPAPPPRRAPRPDPPVVCPGFGLDRFFRVQAERACEAFILNGS